MAQYIKLQENEIIEILRTYNLKQIDYEPIEDSAGNTSYLVRTTQGEYVLTIFEIENIRVVNLCKLLNMLEEHEFSTTRIEKMANGNEISNIGGKSAMLKPFIAGQVVKDLDEDMIAQVGAAMARLHQLPIPDYLPDRHAYGIETFHQAIDQGINLGYENWLAERHEFLLRTIPSELPRGLIHGDVFYDNVLFHGKKFKALIDFEEACHYYKVFDLGMAVVGLCTEKSEVRLLKVQSLLQGYQKIRLLEREEQEILQLFVEYAAIATSSWRYWKYNIETLIAEKSEKHWEMVKIANAVSAISNDEFMMAVYS